MSTHQETYREKNEAGKRGCSREEMRNYKALQRGKDLLFQRKSDEEFWQRDPCEEIKDSKEDQGLRWGKELMYL